MGFSFSDERPLAPPETCICAGVLCTTGYVIRGHRHSDCMATFGYMFPHERVTQEMQGFVTSRNRWVSREEGSALQNAASIVSRMTKQPIRGMLFSEDLY
jgi:hypothetical protein